MHIFESNVFLDRRCSFILNLILLVLIGALIISGLSGCDQIIPPIPDDIVETIPAHGETDVPVDTVIEITFTKSVNQDSLNVWAIPAIDYKASWSTDNTTVTLTLSEDMLEGTTYLVTIEEVLFDDDSSLSQPLSFIFTTVGGDNSTVPLAASEENESTMAAILDKIDDLLLKDETAETVCTQVVQMLQTDPRVAGTGTDPDNNTVWVYCVDGETQIFQVLDENADENEEIPEDDILFSQAGSFLIPNRQSKMPIVTRMGQFDSSEYYHMPGNKKALLANSLAYFEPQWKVNDSTDTLELMLYDCGYDVERVKPTLDVFERLGNYSVIVLETHSTWRPLASLNNNVYCDGMGSQNILLTTTPINLQNPPPSKDDILSDGCSPLVSWTTSEAIMIVNGVRSVWPIRHYGVSADYVRQKITQFPNSTVFVLNACRGIRGDLLTDQTASPFRDLLFDKTDKGAVFLGWDGRVHSFNASRAVLNLFQFATASNESVKVDGRDVLKSFDIPWGGGTDLQLGMVWLQSQGYDFYQKTSALFKIKWQDWTNPYYGVNILMPHPNDINFEEDGKHVLAMSAVAVPEVTVGSTRATVSPYMEGLAGYWNIRLPVGAFGELVATEDDRLSISRTVHRWKPQITMQGKFGYLNYTVNLSLHARAMVDSYRYFPTDALPPATFDTVWDKEACTVSWQVSGEESDGEKSVKYTGSGLRTFGDYEGGTFWTYDGVTATIEVSTQISVTTTETTPSGQTSYEEQVWLGFDRDVPISSTWAIAAQSFEDDDGYGTSQISWGAFSADPPFKSELEPR